MWECMNRLRASLMEHPEGICLNFPKRKRYQRQQSSGSGRIARDVWVACKAALIKAFWCVFLISVFFFFFWRDLLQQTKSWCWFVHKDKVMEPGTCRGAEKNLCDCVPALYPVKQTAVHLCTASLKTKQCLRARAHLCQAGQDLSLRAALLLLLQTHTPIPLPPGSSCGPWARFLRGMSWLFPTWISSAWARSGGSSWRSNITSTARASTARNSSRMTWCWQWKQGKARYGLSCVNVVTAPFN